MNESDAITLLLNTDLLGDLSRETLECIKPAPQWISLQKGDSILRQGERGEAFYLLVSGRLRAFVSDNQGITRQVGEVLPGEGIGEMSLLSEEPVSASVRAIHDSILIRFGREAYLQLMGRSPQMVMKVTQVLVKRLRDRIHEVKRQEFHSPIAIIPLTKNIDSTKFTQFLDSALSQYDSSFIVNRQSLSGSDVKVFESGELLLSTQIEQTSRFFEAYESQYHYVIYQADWQNNSWTQSCLGRSNLILLVATVDSETQLSEVEKQLIATIELALAPRIHLVMLHPNEQWRQQCGISRWLKLRNVDDFHHVRTGRREDFSRLARIITGNAINLVLGGGCARGFAHIGVIRALQEMGVPIDRVAGTSMGALLAAEVALDHDADTMLHVCHDIWIRGNPLGDFTFPAMSIVRGRRLHNRIKSFYQGWNIEDLPLRFFCISTNLSDSELKLHDEGSLWEGMRASGSIPGIGPPLFTHKQILVDGGIVNNLPVDIMQEKFAGVIIVVDVSPTDRLMVSETKANTPSGWQILWNRMNPFMETDWNPSLSEIIYRTITVSSCQLAKKNCEMANLVLTPPLQHFRPMGFNALAEISEVGYSYTLEVLRKSGEETLQRYLNQT